MVIGKVNKKQWLHENIQQCQYNRKQQGCFKISDMNPAEDPGKTTIGNNGRKGGG